MFDYHMHSLISFDGKEKPEDMLRAAEAAGLREICFTDHIDFDPRAETQTMLFDTEAYNAAYDHLISNKLKIRRGMEYGMIADRPELMQQALARRPFDFVLGSVHFVDGWDVYFPPYWEGKTMEQAERSYLEEVLACVQNHDDFDVLGHLTYISKSWNNPTNRPVEYALYADLVDEIFRTLIRKDKGIEVNTSGMGRSGVYLPSREYVQRFHDLGGKIVTVGSDAHAADRVGEYCTEAAKMVAEIFGYVCTFENRQPIFHKI